MKTTEVLVEHFVGGVLITAALFFFFWIVTPEIHQPLEVYSKQPKELLALGGVVLAAVVYSMGLLAEAGTRYIFDRVIMNPTKLKRKEQYVATHRARLHRSAILSGIVVHNQPREVFGLMRFTVMKSGGALDREVEGQVSRLRLVRILFLVQLIILSGVVACFFKDSPSKKPLSECVVLLLVLMFVNLAAIRHRCEMYCRAIERAYEVSVLNPEVPPQDPPHSYMRFE